MIRGTRILLLAAAALPAAGLLCAALAPTGIWPLSLAGHWAPHLALLSLPLWCWVGRRPLPGFAIAMVAAAALWPWLLAAWGRRAPAPAADAATVQVANLFYRSPRHAEALAAVDADLVALIETLPEDRERLRHDPRWPHQFWVTPRAWGGMAVLSRWPLRVQEELSEGAPLVEGTVEAPWGPIRFIAIHTWSPVSPAHAARNRRQFDALADLAAGTGPCLVLGDLNASPGDPDLLGLRGLGLLPPAGGEPATWPSWFGGAGIGIDHALGRGLALGGAGAVWLDGSDHRSLRLRCGPLP